MLLGDAGVAEGEGVAPDDSAETKRGAGLALHGLALPAALLDEQLEDGLVHGARTRRNANPRSGTGREKQRERARMRER